MQGGLFSTLLKPCPHALRNAKHLAGPNLVGIVQLVLVRVEHLHVRVRVAEMLLGDVLSVSPGCTV